MIKTIKEICHPGLGSGSPTFSLKYGAMFGLDARIALAIFGALSVISGAALYSAIQEAKVVAIITEMNEVTKAHESYLLDTGSFLPLWDTSLHTTHINNLIENDATASGWKGPYLPYSTHVDYVLKHTTYENIIIYRINDDVANWGGTEGTDFTAYSGCTVGTTANCNYYTVFEYIPIEIAEAIDNKIDGSVDYKAGNLRIRLYTTGAQSGKATVFIKTLNQQV